MRVKDIRPSDAENLAHWAEEQVRDFEPGDENVAQLRLALQRAREQAGYNGWRNYETWCVHLWITNEETLYNLYRGMAVQAKDVYGAAEAIKETVIKANPLEGASMYVDLCGAALSSVDWDEIAEALRSNE